MLISAKDKVSSFLHLLQQVSLAHQLSLLQREVEILAEQETRLVEIAEKALLQGNSDQKTGEIAIAAINFPGNRK